jgi:hypothetical protein
MVPAKMVAAEGVVHVRFGSKADMRTAQANRFIPNSDRESRHAQMAMQLAMSAKDQ